MPYAAKRNTASMDQPGIRFAPSRLRLLPFQMNKIAMHLASMDHSPSEQLGDPDHWHTTVLVLSESAQHWKLAEDIAKQLGCRNGLLRKWSKNPAYRRSGAFEGALKNGLLGREVYIRVISAQAQTIRTSYARMIRELGLTGFVERLVKNDKPYLKFGPFQRIEILGIEDGRLEEQSEPAEFEITERQALSLIFICHYLLRMHQQLMSIIQKERPELEWIDWQLMPNKFPGDIYGPMSSLFQAIMSGASHQKLVLGNIRIATFDKSNDDLGSAFADNIAGLFAGILETRDEVSRAAFGELGASFDWEIWTLDP
jgi:hypothetical protein